jgi:hypothetical protein
MEHQTVEDEEEEPIRLTTFHYGQSDVPPSRCDHASRVTKRKSSRLVEKARKDKMRKEERRLSTTRKLGLK